MVLSWFREFLNDRILSPFFMSFYLSGIIKVMDSDFRGLDVYKKSRISQ